MNTFIACGVPRSGTTALASLLNWHPAVFCGVERFPLEAVDHTYFTRETVRDRAIPSGHLERNIETLDQKGDLVALGDKGPRYFYRLAGSREAFANMKLIFIIRSLPAVFNSWNQRAFNPEDHSWHRGQTGVFAYLDTMQMLYALNRIKESHEALVLGYEQLFFGERESQHKIISSLFSFLGAPDSAAAHDQFDAESAMRHSLSKRKLGLSPREYEFIEIAQLEAIIEALERAGGMAVPDELSAVCTVLLDDFYVRQREILAAVDTLLRPQFGISHAMTIMRYCYQMAGSNHIYAGLNRGTGPTGSAFELLANMFNARQEGNFDAEISAGEVLAERFPECPDIFVEMSRALKQLNDTKGALEYSKRAAALQ